MSEAPKENGRGLKIAGVLVGLAGVTTSALAQCAWNFEWVDQTPDEYSSLSTLFWLGIAGAAMSANLYVHGYKAQKYPPAIPPQDHF